MLEKIIKIVADHLGVDEGEITAESKFSSLDVDSLDMVEIVMQLEEEFNVSLEDMQTAETVQDLINYIQKQQA